MEALKRFAMIATSVCLIGQVPSVAIGRAVKVVDVARAFPDGGGYEWKGSGVPSAVMFDGVQILPKSKEGTYCSGFTFAVVMKAAEERNLLVGKSIEQIRAFQRDWYGATEDSGETQCVLAMQKLGIGDAVPMKRAKAGDFLQLWRTNKSGHSVVFLEWVVEGGHRVGMKYRSTQKSTKGIGDRVEFFADAPGKGGLVDPKRIYFCRLHERPRKGR